ncbi:MAG: hypothetical protein E6Q78_10025 [Rhodoferax sp.]|nr:MAG: hypothetical protein E6Q78_10025 [Rhodoferax sp.]
MTSLSRQCVATVVALVALFAPFKVMACGFAMQRAQITLFGQLNIRSDALPQESALKVGDLISVLVPRNTKSLVVANNDQPSSALVAITPDRYQLLSKEGGGSIPPEVHIHTDKTDWLHFGAASPGIAYLKLASGSERGLVRVKISDRPEVVRGTNLNWTDGRQSEPISLSPFDTLTIDLPGEPGSGWLVRMRHGKATLKSASLAESATESSKPRVLLRVEAYPGEAEDELIVTRSGAESYRFVVRTKAIPKC